MEKLRLTSSLNFFREFHRINEEQPLKWAVIVTTEGGVRKLSLGVFLPGTTKVLDVARREFVSANAKNRRTFFAERVISGKNYEYMAIDGSVLVLPRDYVRRSYFRSVYSKKLIRADI